MSGDDDGKNAKIDTRGDGIQVGGTDRRQGQQHARWWQTHLRLNATAILLQKVTLPYEAACGAVEQAHALA